MESTRPRAIVAIAVGVLICGFAFAGETGNRKELERVDLSVAPRMEVISSVSEYKPGETIARHYHHGIESGYVLQGGFVQPPGKEPMKIPTGASILNLRDVPHAGFTVVGDTALRVFTVHIVDKGKPLYEWVK